MNNWTASMYNVSQTNLLTAMTCNKFEYSMQVKEIMYKNTHSIDEIPSEIERNEIEEFLDFIFDQNLLEKPLVEGIILYRLWEEKKE